jgi:predicted aspartyl protease
LPPAIIADLRLVWLDSGNAFLADGSEVFFDVFDGAIVWDRHNVAIQVDEADTTPLVGTELLEGYELSAQFWSRGKVAIKSLRRRGG